jgi:hypothetical protein
MRYSEAFADALFQEVLGMEESTTYQAIIRKGVALGEVKGAQHVLLSLGEEPFGPPDAAVLAAVQAITDVERPAALAKRIREVQSWQELLSLPAAGPRPRRRRTR